MVTYKDAENLLRLSAAAPAVLSLYLPVPLDPVGLRGVAAQAGDLMAQACAAAPDGDGTRDGAHANCVSRADRDAVLGELAAHGREWLGRTVAFFACARLGLFEALPLPYALPGRAVLATRPYIRPMLAALQRYPDYRVAIVDRQHAWLLSVSGGRVETFARQSAEGERGTGFGGWYGLEAHRVQQRVIQLERRHYRDVAAILSQPGAGRTPPLVIGGHHESIAGLLEVLPPAVQNAYAGSFFADPRTLTPATVRGLAQPVIDGSVLRREQRLTAEILGDTPPRLAAVGLPACLAAVGEGAVAHLLIAREDMISGFACGRCGALTADPDECPGCGAAARAVPDLLEEMARMVLDGNGLVTTLREAPFTVAARLRFPVAAGEATLRGEQR